VQHPLDLFVLIIAANEDARVAKLMNENQLINE